MGKIVVTENVTLDGVVRDPMGEEGTQYGGWFGGIGDRDRAEWSRVLERDAMGAQALLLGRRTDKWFADRWLSREGTWADRLNGMPKYVASATLEQPAWTNVTVLRGDLAQEAAALKQELDGEIVVYGSIEVAHALAGHDLVDEWRLVVFPVVAGGGERLFTETDEPRPLRLLSAQPVGDRLAWLSYERIR
jgi:dihydrofolate reductase